LRILCALLPTRTEKVRSGGRIFCSFPAHYRKDAKAQRGEKSREERKEKRQIFVVTVQSSVGGRGLQNLISMAVLKLYRDGFWV
jgi:hypothetical protein